MVYGISVIMYAILYVLFIAIISENKKSMARLNKINNNKNKSVIASLMGLVIICFIPIVRLIGLGGIIYLLICDEKDFYELLEEMNKNDNKRS